MTSQPLPLVLSASRGWSESAVSESLEGGWPSGSAGLSPELEAAFELVGERLDETLGYAQVPSLDDAGVVSSLRVVEGLQRKITALQLVLAAEAEERTRGRSPGSALALKYGCKNTVELVQRTTLVSGREARQRVRLGQLVVSQNGYSSGMLPARYPILGDALAQGYLGGEAVLAITSMLGKIRVHDGNESQLVTAERELVNAVACNGAGVSVGESSGVLSPMHTDQTRVQCGVWQQFLEPDGVLPNEEEAFLKRGFRFGRARDGLVPVSGALAPETAALLGRLFDSVNSPRTDTNREAPVAPLGAGVAGLEPSSGQSRVRFPSVPQEDTVIGANAAGSGSGSGSDAVAGTLAPGDEIPVADSRTPDQKRHDALAVFLETVARHPDTPLLGGAPVTVLVQVTEEDLTAARATSKSQGVAWLHDHVGETVPVSMRVARHAACSGAMQRVTQDHTGRIIGLESPGRVFTAHQRRAITLRDGGCVIPGCTTPASWCEVHHVTEHANGGPTHTDNGVLLCWYHHRSLDTNGWQVRMNKGVPETRAPGWLDPDRPWRTHHPPGQTHWTQHLTHAA